MLSQTVDQLLPILQLMTQPAFCLRQNGTVAANAAAAPLAPASGNQLSLWLGDAAEAYALWDRSGSLQLPLTLQGLSCSAQIQALSDGTLFILSPCAGMQAGSSSFSVASQVLRQPLSDLSGLTQRLSDALEDLEDPALLERSSAINRQIYRLSRIACNLADLDQLLGGAYPFRPERLELTDFLRSLQPEMEALCGEAGHPLTLVLPQKTLVFPGDPMLLERALWNLLSNACKYSVPNSPISLKAGLTDSAILLQLANRCAPAHTDLLTAAFHRLEQRGTLPDPSWGIGLGLPMSQAIARLHGGTVAVQLDGEDQVTVTLSLSRKKSFDVARVHAPAFDYTGGMRHSLVELADVLPDDCFCPVGL